MVNNKSLRRDTGLAVVDYPGLYSGLCSLIKIGARHHDKGIAAAKLQQAFLDLFTRSSGYAAACANASSQRNCSNATVGYYSIHTVRTDEQCLKSFFRETGATENVFNGNGALWHVGSMLEQANVASHERRRCKAKHLPEWEIPRHYGQHRAERLVTHEAACGICLSVFVSQKSLGILSIVTTAESAFLRFLYSRFERLAHFLRHHPAKSFFFFFQDFRGTGHHFCALAK